MNEEGMAHIHNGMLLIIKEKATMPSAATWMDPEMIILIEVSQTEQDKYWTTLLTCGI